MADTVHPPTEEDKSKTGLESFLGETLIITGIGAVLYFWGILYYLQLTESLGLGLSLFSVSPYEVIIAPWDNAISALIWSGLLWLLWHQIHIYLVIAYYTLALVLIPVAFCFKIANGIKFIRCINEGIGNSIKKKLTFFRKIPRPSDELLANLNNPTNDRRMFRATFHMIIIFAIIGTGLYMPAKAKARVKAHLESTQKSHIEVLCTDDSIVKGEYVLALGDAIVVDLEQAGQPMRVLIKQAQIKRIIKLLPMSAEAVKQTPTSTELVPAIAQPEPAPLQPPTSVPPATK